MLSTASSHLDSVAHRPLPAALPSAADVDVQHPEPRHRHDVVIEPRSDAFINPASDQSHIELDPAEHLGSAG